MSFLHNLYTLLNYTDIEKTIQLCNDSHEVFQAHFPNNPILPGFLQIELIEELFNIHITTIKKAKFLNLVTPNMILILQKKGQKICIKNEHQKKISELIYE
jgi:3-hydroxyacyl-[acyl-carrier-protein] dehydratase